MVFGATVSIEPVTSPLHVVAAQKQRSLAFPAHPFLRGPRSPEHCPGRRAVEDQRCREFGARGVKVLARGLETAGCRACGAGAAMS